MHRPAPSISAALLSIPVTFPSSRRRWILLGMGAYCLLFYWAYVTVIAPLFGSTGMQYLPPTGALQLLPWFLALVPAWWMPSAVRRPSQLFIWVIYLTVYLPSQFVPLYTGTASLSETVSFMLALAFNFALLSSCMILPVLDLARIRFPGSVFWTLVGVFAFSLNAYVLAVFHPYLRVVSLADVYGQRAVASAVSEGRLVTYAISWLGYALNPFFMAWGLHYRRRIVFLVGALGQLFLYATGGAKLFILSVPVMAFMWFALRSRGARFGPVLTWTAVGGVALVTAISLLRSAAVFLASLLIVRTLSLPGLLSAQYLAFFSSHPHTMLSHVRGFSSFITYPYDRTVAYTIGEYFTGSTSLDANAHFWVGDGVAGFGIPGMFVVTPVVMAVLWILDSAPRRGHREVAVLMCVGQAAHLANASAFTTMLGGGLWLTTLLAFFLPTRPR